MRIGVIGGFAAIAALALTGCFDKQYAAEEDARRQGKDLNDLRIEQNEKCLNSHMLPELVEGEIVCAPDVGKIRIRQYFDYLYAEQVIREKTNKPLPPKFKPGEELPFSKDNFESKQKKTD